MSAVATNGYKFKNWSVSFNSGTEIKLIEVEDNKFTMPAANVTVSADFEKSSNIIPGGGGVGGAVILSEFLIEDILIKDNKAFVILDDINNIISEEAILKLIELNKTLSIIIEGNGFKIIIPIGTLKTGDDINDMIPEETEFTGNGWVVTYVDSLGNRKIVPWSVSTGSIIKFIAPAGGKYELINNIQSFNDISGHWGVIDINSIASRMLFMGTGGDNFSPDLSMNRAMLVTVLHRLDGLRKEEIEVLLDVPEGQWYSDAVSWAVSSNIISKTYN